MILFNGMVSDEMDKVTKRLLEFLLIYSPVFLFFVIFVFSKNVSKMKCVPSESKILDDSICVDGKTYSKDNISDIIMSDNNHNGDGYRRLKIYEKDGTPGKFCFGSLSPSNDCFVEYNTVVGLVQSNFNDKFVFESR